MKKTEVVDIRIEIDPTMGTFGSKAWLGSDYIPDKRRLAEEMVEQIKRHVDSSKYTRIVEETEDTCEFCGAPWTEYSPYYNGGCCDDDDEYKISLEGAKACS